MRKYNVNDNYFDVIGDEQAWLLGLLAADGWISGNQVGIAQSGNDGLLLIQHIKNILDCDAPISHTKTTHKISHGIKFTSTKIIDRLSDFNIVKKKSLIYEYPENISQQQFHNFLRGYMDGDGFVGVYSTKTTKKFLMMGFLGTKKFVYRVNELIPVKNAKVNIHSQNKRCFELRFSGQYAISFGKFLYTSNNIYKSIKYQKFDEHLQYWYENSEKSRFDQKRKNIQKLLNEGKSVMECSRLTNCRFQIIYKWIKDGKLYNNK